MYSFSMSMSMDFLISEILGVNRAEIWDRISVIRSTCFNFLRAFMIRTIALYHPRVRDIYKGSEAGRVLPV